jgi:hypothetical protein
MGTYTVFNVMQSPYSAYGDNSHDDTAALQQAIADAIAAGGTVLLPPPPVAYKITKPLQIYGNGTQSIIMLGSRSQAYGTNNIIYWGPSNSSIMQILGMQNCYFSDIGVNPNAGTVSNCVVWDQQYSSTYPNAAYNRWNKCDVDFNQNPNCIAYRLGMGPNGESNGFNMRWDHCNVGDGTPIVNAPAAPTLTQSSGGTLPARTEYYKITFATLHGETTPSGESSFSVNANNLVSVTSPSNPGGITTGYNVYAATTAGAETLQNSSPIAFGTDWIEPTTGLTTTGVSPPSINTTVSTGTIAWQIGGSQNYSPLFLSCSFGTSCGILCGPIQTYNTQNINPTDTTITVADTLLFPPSGTLQIGSPPQQVGYTVASANTLKLANSLGQSYGTGYTVSQYLSGIGVYPGNCSFTFDGGGAGVWYAMGYDFLILQAGYAAIKNGQYQSNNAPRRFLQTGQGAAGFAVHVEINNCGIAGYVPPADGNGVIWHGTFNTTLRITNSSFNTYSTPYDSSHLLLSNYNGRPYGALSMEQCDVGGTFPFHDNQANQPTHFKHVQLNNGSEFVSAVNQDYEPL